MHTIYAKNHILKKHATEKADIQKTWKNSKGVVVGMLIEFLKMDYLPKPVVVV